MESIVVIVMESIVVIVMESRVVLVMDSRVVLVMESRVVVVMESRDSKHILKTLGLFVPLHSNGNHVDSVNLMLIGAQQYH